MLRRVRGQGNTHFPVQLTTKRIGNLTRLIHTLLYVMASADYSLRGYLRPLNVQILLLPIAREKGARRRKRTRALLCTLSAGVGCRAAPCLKDITVQINQVDQSALTSLNFFFGPL